MADIDTDGPGGKRSFAPLINDATEQISRLVHDEMRLAEVALQRKGERLGVGAGLC